MPKHSEKTIASFFKGLYSDSYKWDIIKSVGLFALGIRIAHEFIGVEIMPSIPQ